MIFKYLHKLISAFVLLLLFSGVIVGQTVINESKYDSLKSLGLINNSDQYNIILHGNISRQSGRFNPPDSTYLQAITPSDDGTSALISLPFNFCFWGNPENQVYINNNGNISFEQAFTSGTPFNLPFSNFKVIAPFWSDVDTRARGGVYYKILPNALIVNWQDVGHFDQGSSRGNSYQLIITDGTSELLPFGYTVGFFYDKIEWTAGTASGGVGGFGGAPAIIGMNLGDGIHFTQAGKFDKNDTAFVADIDTLNGVVRLVDKHIFFNPCDSVNNKPGMMGAKLKDTIGVCVGDTLNEIYSFFAPENNQQTFVSVNTTGFPGFSVISTQSGQMATAEIQIVGSVSNIGFHTVSFTVIDNGFPSKLVEIDLVFQVDSLPIPLEIVGDSSICEYEMTTLSVSSGYDSYLWNNGAKTPSINVSPGNYKVEVSYNNCVEEKTHQVSAHIPTTNITGPKFICLPDTVLISAPFGNDSYLWSTGDTVFETQITQQGIYIITITDQNCIKKDSIQIEELGANSVTISTSNIHSCNGDSVTLSVPNYFDAVLWSDGTMLNFIKVLAGTYSVTVTVNSGIGTVCNSTDQIIITNDTIIPVQVMGDSLICGDDNTVYNVVGIYDTYLWDNGSENPTSTFKNAGGHWLTATSGTCFDTAYFSITQNSLPNLDIQGNLFYCDTVDSSRLVAVGGPWDSLFWNTGEITDTIYTGFGWKNATAWKDGCKTTKDFPVNELINGVDVKGITELCPGQSTRLDVEFGFDFYQWNTGAIGFSTTVATPGDYWCVVNLDTCFATTDTITVTMNTPDTAQILGDTVMCDTSGGFLYVDLAFTQFNWSTGETTPVIKYSTSGVYSVTVQDAGYCITSDTINVTQRPTINVDITGGTHYCFKDSTIIFVGSFDHYLWSNGDTVRSIKVRQGVYAITVTNNDGCRAKDGNWKVGVTSPQAIIQGDSAICAEQIGVLFTNSKKSDTIIWSTGEVTDSIRVESGNYALTLTDVFGCVSRTTRDVIKLATPVAAIEMDPNEISQAYSPVHFYDNSELTNVEVSEWFWNVNNNWFSYSQDTILTFYNGMQLNVIHAVTSTDGCTDTVSTVYVISSDIVKTNVITPNGDGINDYLVFPNLQMYSKNELIIFNRWGVEIARFENYRNFWDAYNVSDGVYFYILYLDEGVNPVKGSFSIFR